MLSDVSDEQNSEVIFKVYLVDVGVLIHATFYNVTCINDLQAGKSVRCEELITWDLQDVPECLENALPHLDVGRISDDEVEEVDSDDSDD